MRWILILWLSTAIEARGVFSSLDVCEAVGEEHYRLTEIGWHCVAMPLDKMVTDIHVVELPR